MMIAKERKTTDATRIREPTTRVVTGTGTETENAAKEIAETATAIETEEEKNHATEIIQNGAATEPKTKAQKEEQKKPNKKSS